LGKKKKAAKPTEEEKKSKAKVQNPESKSRDGSEIMEMHNGMQESMS